MTKKDFCPICGDVTDITTITRAEVAHMCNTEVTHKATFYKCEVCHEEFDTPESMDANLKSAREAFDRLSRTTSASGRRTPQTIILLILIAAAAAAVPGRGHADTVNLNTEISNALVFLFLRYHSLTMYSAFIAMLLILFVFKRTLK